jgi:hypothetical protein
MPAYRISCVFRVPVLQNAEETFIPEAPACAPGETVANGGVKWAP